jgi:hypothetical protein
MESLLMKVMHRSFWQCAINFTSTVEAALQRGDTFFFTIGIHLSKTIGSEFIYALTIKGEKGFVN